MRKLEGYDKNLDYSYCLGVFPSLELLLARPDRARRLLLHPDGERNTGVEKLRERCADLGIREEFAPKALARISKKDNCYAALVFEKYQDTPDPASPHILLHHVSDGGNLGTILRTALGLGYHDLIIIRPAVDFFDPHVLRASMGAAFRMRVAVYDSMDAVPLVGRNLYPFMLDGAMPLEAAVEEAQSPFTLAFGNEGAGLPPEFAKMGQSVVIPYHPEIDSLNLAVAAAIGMYAFSRKLP